MTRHTTRPNIPATNAMPANNRMIGPSKSIPLNQTDTGAPKNSASATKNIKIVSHRKIRSGVEGATVRAALCRFRNSAASSASVAFKTWVLPIRRSVLVCIVTSLGREESGSQTHQRLDHANLGILTLLCNVDRSVAL